MTLQLSCPPRFATRRTDRPTLGPAIAKTARILGKPLMPWQRYVADVVGEVVPETGLLAYRDWGLTVPRQSGKTTLVLAKSTHRCLATDFFGGRQRVLYTAQTRNDARRKWDEEFVEDLLAAPLLRGKFSVRKSNGSEHVRFVNGSRFGPEANTEKSGHGPTVDEAFVDEAFSRVDNRSEQAFKPAMVTRLLAQFGVVSTAGWLGESPYLWSKVELGRQFAAEGRTDGIAYFEWSAPEDAESGDRRVWRRCMPALGYTINEDIIAVDYANMSTNEFRRAYLNIWVPKDAPDDPVISLELWDSRADPYTGRLAPVAFGVTTTPDRSRTTIGVAGQRADGMPYVEVMAEQPGIEWAVSWIKERVARWDPCAIILDGTALWLKRELAAHKIEAEATTSTDRAQATIDFYDAVIEDRLRHNADPAVSIALASAAKRPMAHRWVWDGPAVGPIQAVTLALDGLTRFGKPSPPPATPQLAGGGEVEPANTADLAHAGF
jgi:hypothetical protein